MLFDELLKKDLFARADERLHSCITEKRRTHTYAVTELAMSLAQHFAKLGADIDVESTVLAALLHDATKYMDQNELCEKYGIVPSKDDLASPQTLHALTGAYYAKEEFCVNDDVFSAILKHTVGGNEMSLCDKIIFVSDYCEETRIHEECKRSREDLLKVFETGAGELHKAERILDKCTLEILKKTLAYLAGKSEIIHGQTVLSYERLLEKYEGDEEFSSLNDFRFFVGNKE